MTNGVFRYLAPGRLPCDDSHAMTKAALTFADLLMVLVLGLFGLREFLTIQLGMSDYLPNAGQVIGFDAVKVGVFSLCAWGVVYFAKRIRSRFRSA